MEDYRPCARRTLQTLPLQRVNRRCPQASPERRLKLCHKLASVVQTIIIIVSSSSRAPDGENDVAESGKILGLYLHNDTAALITDSVSPSTSRLSARSEPPPDFDEVGCYHKCTCGLQSTGTARGIRRCRRQLGRGRESDSESRAEYVLSRLCSALSAAASRHPRSFR